jgi:hypothetical protein
LTAQIQICAASLTQECSPVCRRLIQSRLEYILYLFEPIRCHPLAAVANLTRATYYTSTHRGDYTPANKHRHNFRPSPYGARPKTTSSHFEMFAA